MNVTWPWLLGLFLPVVLVAWWALRRPRRQVLTVPSLTPWTQALAQGAKSDRVPTPRVKPSWLCLLLGAVLAVTAAADLGRDARPARRYVTCLIAGGEMDRLEFENAAAALLGRLDAADRVRLVYPAALPEEMTPRGWLSPSLAQQAIRQTPLVPVPASLCRFPVVEIDPTQTFLFAPAETVAPGPLGATLIACRSAKGPIVCRRATTASRDDGGMDVSIVVANDGDEPRTIELSRWTGQTPDEARRREQNYQALGPRVLAAGDLIAVTFESPGPLAGLRIVDGVDGTRQEVLVTASDQPQTMVFLAGEPNAMLERFVAIHPSLERTSDLHEAAVLIGNGQELPGWDGPAILFGVPQEPRLTTPIEDQILATARIDRDHAVMNGVDLSAVAVRRITSGIHVDESSETLASHGDVALIVADPLRNSPQIRVAFDIATQNTNWTSDASFVIFMSNAMDWLAETPTASLASIYPGQAPRDWVERWTLVGPSIMTGVDYWPMPGFWVDPAGVVHAVSEVGFSGWASKTSGIERARAALLSPARAVRERRSFGWLLSAFSIGFWLLGWTLAAEGR